MAASPPPSSSSSPAETVGRRFAKGAALSFGLRLASFGLNLLTKRLVSPKTLGRADVTLDLLLGSTVFLSREGWRLSLGRIGFDHCNVGDGRDQSGDEGAKKRQRCKQQLSNTAYLSVLSGAGVCLVSLFIHLRHCRRQALLSIDAGDGDYLIGGLIYVLAGFLEICSEPLALLCLRSMDIKGKAAAEGMGNLARAVCNVLLLGGYMDRSIIALSNLGGRAATVVEGGFSARYPISCFGIGHIVYALVTGEALRRRCHSSSEQEISDTAAAQRANVIQWLVSSPGRANFHIPTIKLASVFTAQSIFKHLLTEGDRIVLTLLSTDHDRGVYSMASSIGAIAGRMLLQPIEESARLLFGRLGQDLDFDSIPDSAGVIRDRNGRASKQQHLLLLQQQRLSTLQSTYTSLVKLVIYLGLTFAALGTNYTSIVLRILFGSRWGSDKDAASVLSAFCVYTATLALNGMTEAFVYGMTKRSGEVGVLSAVHALVMALVFGIISPRWIRSWGTVGLVQASCLAMALRSLYSVYFAACYFESRRRSKARSVGRSNEDESRWSAHYMRIFPIMAELTRTMLPEPIVLLSFGITYGLTSQSRIHMEALEYTIMESSGMNDKGLTMARVITTGRHISLGLVCAIGTALLAYSFERKLGRDLRTIFGKQKND